MKKLFLSLTLALLLILSVAACTNESGESESATIGGVTSEESITTPKEDTQEESITASKGEESVADTETSEEESTESETEIPTEEVTTLPDEPEKFTSDVSSNAAGTVLNQTDLSPYFVFDLNGGTYQNTSWAYQLDGISEMYAPLYGKYALSVNFSLGTEGSGYAFVRGVHKVLSTDASAPQISSFYETDGSESDMGGAGIYAKIEDGILTLMMKVYDESVGTRVKNVYYSIDCVGSELTLADDGEKVYVLVNGITYATVKLSGNTSYEGLAQTEPATEFASTAEITLKDGRTDTLTNTLIDSDSYTQGGLVVRSGVICFTSVKVMAFSDVIIPDLDMAVGNTDITKMPDFKVSGVFSSHMVLQREQPIKIWGFSNAEGSTVTGTFGGETVTAQVKHDGRWELTFAPQAYQTVGQAMTISDDRGHETVLEDILIGDVWFIAGQSNAEMNVGPCMNYAPDFVASADDNIRLFTQTQAYAASQQEACRTPQLDVINPAWTWQRADKRSIVRNFSALGYFFAKELIKDTDVPQGIVMIAAGGACLSELLPAELAKAQRYTSGGLVCIGGYYNTLVYPFIGMPCKGMLFFQGESESGNKNLARKYAEEMTMLIRYERERWGQDFPLYYVQLSDYLAGGAAAWPYLDMVRAQQFDALETISNSTLIVSMDLGAPEGYSDWAHSPFKYELAGRVAKVVLSKEYGVGEESRVSSPMPMTATLSADNSKITIEFKNVADGLTVLGLSPEESIGKTVEGFSVGVYGRLKTATATITSKNTVTVDVPTGSDPSQVNYAYFVTITPENANLYGSNGLPAPAFSLQTES